MHGVAFNSVFCMTLLLAAVCAAAQPRAAESAPWIPSPPQEIVDLAISGPLFTSTDRWSSGTGTAFSGPLPEVLALAAHAGNTSADARLIEQIQTTLNGRDSPLCAGYYPSQKELRVFTMLVIVRNTPRIWDQLSQLDREKADALMKAALVANAYMSAENNPDVIAAKAPGAPGSLRGQQRSFRGVRGFAYFAGGNIRTGQSGCVLAAVAYFGPDKATSILETYDHASFTARLGELGLTNPYDTFNHRNRGVTEAQGANGLSEHAPTAEEIETAIRDWNSRGATISTLRRLVITEINHSFSRNVVSGLNDGAGATRDPDRGRIAEPWPRPLPNAGARGMLFEFDTGDAPGQRSSSTYSTKTLRNALDILICALFAGWWDPAGEEERALRDQIHIGVVDWDFKMTHGYRDFAHGGRRMTRDVSYEIYSEPERNWFLPITLSLWVDVLKPYLDVNKPAPRNDDQATGTGALTIPLPRLTGRIRSC
jgi:hypothetical protein